MAQLLVRGLEVDLVKRLKMRASENGVSAEEEHRKILREALTESRDRSFYEHLAAMPDVGDDEIFERSGDYPREVEL